MDATVRDITKRYAELGQVSDTLLTLEQAVIDEGHSADSGYNCDVCRALAALDAPVSG